MAALTRSGARNASEIVMLTLRTLQLSRSDWCDDPELGQMRADGIDHSGLLADKQWTGTVQRQAAHSRAGGGAVHSIKSRHKDLVAIRPNFLRARKKRCESTDRGS
jgi:hypothetical protein